MSHWSVDDSRDVTVYAFAKPNDGAIFIGWFDNEGCTGDPLSAQAEAYPIKKTVNKNSTETTTLYAKFSTTAPITGASFNPTSLIYDGTTKSMPTLTVMAGALTLGAGDYDVLSGQTSAAGSPATNCTYTVTVQGKGNFTGTASASWTIVAPSGSFAADAASGGVGCTASGTSVELTDSLALNPTYDSEKGTWKVAMTVTWPAPVTKNYTMSDYGTATYIDAAHAFVEMGGSVYSGTQVLNNEADGLTATTGSGSYAYSLIGGTKNFTYFKSLTYTLEFSVADVDAAKAAGKIEKSITVWSVIWKGGDNNTCGSSTGLKATTYTLTIPIDDKLILQDTEGRQIYPPHQHNWAYAVSADGKTLVATCGASGCPQETLSFGFTGETAKTYDGTALAAQLTDATEFVKHTGATIGSITYDDAADQPVNAGDHTAKVVIAVGGGNYTISQTMTINPAAFDLSLNISSVNYDGAAKTVVATAKFGQKTLAEGTDYDISGDNRTQTGSPASNCTYTVIATGKGNFANCEKSATWTIVAPSGSFAADALSTSAGGCSVDSEKEKVVTVTDSAGLAYVGENLWRVSATIKFPVTLPGTSATQGDANVKYIDQDHLIVNTNRGEVALDIQTKEYKAVVVLATHHYINTLTWTVDIPLAEFKAAIEADKTELVYDIEIGALRWTHYADGIRATTYQIKVPLSNIVLNDDQGRQIYPPHQHSWSYAVSADGKTLVATCQAQGCPQETLSFGFTGATNKVYDSKAFVAELADSTEFVKHTGATIGEIAYTDNFEGAFVGTYQASVVVTVGGKDYTLVEAYTIDPKPLTSVTLSATSFDYDATEKSVTVAEVKSDTFKTDDYDIVEGSVLAEKGSGIENKTYTVTVQGKNNFCGTASATWTIKAPTGSVGAMKAVGGGCAVDQSDAKKVIVTDSTALTYSPDTNMWSIGLNVAIPSSNIGGITDPTCTFPDDLFVTVSSNAVQVTKNSKYNDGSSRKYHYMTSVDAKVWFSVADVLAAKAAGLDAMEYTVTIFARKGQYNSSGLKEVTYVISISLEGLVLNDEQGVQQYPEHQHDWSVAASGEPVNTLTATCSAHGCPQSPLTLALAAVSRDYDGKAFAATLTGADAFRTHVGATVGDITYWAKGAQLQSAPKYTGDYEARVAVTALNTPYTLVVPFAITKPAGGYTSGWELAKQGVAESKWVRYDTCTNATANADDGDTIIYHSGYDGDARQLAVTSDHDVTIDLNGKTLQRGINGDFELYNGGSGVITLKNGTIKQPTKNLDIGNIVFIGAADKSGSFVLGAGLTLENVGWVSGTYLQVEVKGIGLEIIGGQYQIRGFALEDGGSVSVKGGKFWSNFNPAAFVPSGYAVREISGDYKYEVVALAAVTVGVELGGGIAAVDFGDVTIETNAVFAAFEGQEFPYSLKASNDLVIAVYKLDGVVTTDRGVFAADAVSTNLVFTAVEGAEPGHGATDAELKEAIRAARGESAAALCGEGGAQAQAVAAWIKAKGVTSAALEASDYTAASFALGTSVITNGTPIAFTDFAFTSNFTFKVTLNPSADAEAITGAAIADYLKTAEAVTNEFKTIASERVSVADDGTVTVRRDPALSMEFLDFEIEKDN